jgi:transcriptional regulator with XRE-family HTH domain
MRQKFDYGELRERIREKYGTQEDFARAAGISPAELAAKLKNADYFTQSEIYTLHGLLGIDGREITQLFFTKKLKKT